MTPRARRFPSLIAILVALVALPGPVDAQERPPAAPDLLLHGVSVVDGVQAEPRVDVSILVRDGRIEAIGPRATVQAPAGATQLELEGYWVVPGLLDAHSHLNTLDAARRALESGVTTIRTAGVGGYADVALRDAVRGGWLAGPDILATGVYVTPAIGDGALADQRLRPFLADSVDTAEELRRLVAVNADRGVDWIKTRATERAGTPSTDPREQGYTEQELGSEADLLVIVSNGHVVLNRLPFAR